MLPEGFVAGTPQEYTNGTTIAFTSDDGEAKQGVVIGRALFDGEKFVPAESGRFIELYVPGEDEPSHIHEDRMSERVVGYLGENIDQNNEPQEPETEQSAEVEQPTQEQQSVISDTPTEETQETQTEQPAETGKIPAQLTYEGIIAKYGDNAGHKIDVTIADKQQELAKAQKDLDKKQKAYDDAPIGKEDKAERELAKAQQEYSKILAETQSWDAIKAEHEKAVSVPVQEQEEPQMAPEASEQEQRIENAENAPVTQIIQPKTEEKEQSVSEKKDVQYRLSDEIDNNGRQFVLNSKGDIAFGYIGEDTGLNPAPILLSEGMITDPSTNAGYGLAHIEARHGEQIRKAGYNSVLDFVEHVGNNYETIREGKDRNGNPTFLLQLTDKHNNTLVVELSNDGIYWNINTAGIFNRKYASGKDMMYSRHTQTNQPAETGEGSLDAEQGGTQTKTSTMPSTIPVGKDTKNSGTDQKNIEKKSESTINQNVASSVTAQSRKPKEGNVPDMVVDKASDARARGFRMKDGNRYDRQKQIEDGVSGKLTSIDFSTTEKPVSAHYTVVEADELQPSHIGGSRNPLHFISEAQPKERTDDVSDIESTRIAQNIAPEKITSSTNAYGGAPVINSRGEVIQGNNRAIALRKLQGYPQAEERYRQYLVDHAKDFGFDDNGIGRIKAMKHPVLVRQTDRSLTDEEAIRLGQFKATDLETGGIVRIEAAPTLAKMNAQSVESAMNILLGTADENDESSLNQLIEANGGNLIGYLVRKGAITETQAQSAFGRGDRLTEDARSDIRKLVLQTMFSDAPDNIEAMFNRIPSAAQKALMQVIAGDMRLGQRERLLPDIQNAIMAAGEVQERLSGQLNEVRKNKDARTRHEEIRKLMVYASRQPDITGNTVISQDYSELELEIATILLSDAQNSIKAIFSEYQRYVNGEPTIFGGVERLSREEAVEKTFKVKDTRYGTERQTDSTTGNSRGSVEQTGAQRGQTGETGLLERPRMADGVSADQESVQPSGRPGNGGESAVGGKSGGFDESGRPGQVTGGVSADKAEAAFTDNQGNPTDESGNLILERVGSVDEITDEDFTSPTRNIELPAIPQNIDDAIGANGKPIVIKKNVFEKNNKNHKDLTSGESRRILSNVFFSPNLYGQNQKATRPYNWILIHLADKNESVIVEVNENKDNVEVVNWHYLDSKALEQKKRQAMLEGGRILTLESVAGNTQKGLSSVGKDTKNSGTDKEKNAEMQLEPITNSVGEVENIEELKDSNPDVSTEEAEDSPVETAAKAAKQTKLNIETQSQEKIEDFGEKIGGARKDTAKSGFKRGDGDGRPAWRKKYKFINTDETVELGVSGLSTGRGLYSAGSIIKALYQSKPHAVSNIDGDFDADKPFYAYYEEKKKTRWGMDVKYRPIVGKDGKLVRFSNVQEAEKVIPVFEAEQQGFRVKAGADGKFVVYRTASNGKNVEYDEFDSREDAVAYLLSEEGATSLLNRKRENFEFPGLDKVTREGVPDYRNGKNVTTDDFMETFGFRGGEFGNWVNNDERQSALNTAYDALMDLATVLGLSPRALSLGGRLGIAFGARGTAGAKAHYEPVKAVINLTKVHGAGSLAHEWGHALDNYFALMDSKTDRNTAQERDLESFMTEGQSWKKGVREEIRDIFSKIVDVLTKKKVTKKIALSEEQEAYDNIIRAIDKEARYYRTLFEQGRTTRRYNRKTKEYETVTVKPTTEQLEEYDRLVEELKDDDTFLWGPYPTGDVAKKLMTLVKDVEPGKRGRYQPLRNLWYYRTRLTPQKKRLAKAKNGESEEVSVESDILKNSEWFDKMRATPYFSQNIEMFARAFESYVERKMTGNGMQSTYLTYEKGSIYQSVWEHNPYPAGEEAGKLDVLFDEFFKTVQEKEIDGKTVLYHKADGEAVTIDEADMAMAEGLEEIFREAGIKFSSDVEKGQRLLDRVNGNIKMSAAESERRREREEIRNTIAEAISIVTGKSMAEAKRELVESEAQRKMDAKEIYGIILSGEYNSVSLQKIQDFINNATPENKYGRRVSERLPQRVEREMLKGKRGDEVEALYTRASESAIPANERTREATRGGIAEAKKSLLEKWAKAAGKWHTELSDFTDASEPIDSGHDSDVYPARDREHVIKLSRGKNDKRFKSDPDAVTLFNYVFPNSAYRVLGYGNFGKGFVRILEQPYVNFATSTPLTVEERVEYMDRLGFKPINKECTAFSNGELLVADLQKSNIVRSKDGNIRVIDADVKLHTKDVGGNYTYLPVEHDLPDGANVKQMKVFHGSGAEFEAFDNSHIGEGEGAQAYGWGTYVTEVEGIGKRYAQIYGPKQVMMNGVPIRQVLNNADYWDTAFSWFVKGYEHSLDELKTNVQQAYIDGRIASPRSKRVREFYKQKERLLQSLENGEITIEGSPNILYTVEIPDNNGSNYIDWERTLDRKRRKRIADAVRNLPEEMLDRENHGPNWLRGGWNTLANVIEREQLAGLEIRERLVDAFKEDRERNTSNVLDRAGFVGISYPAQYLSGGREDKARNFVIFNESNLQITDKMRFFRTESGEVYGFTLDGEIYIDKRIAGSETYIHEYTHLWAEALRKANSKAWEQLKKEMFADKDLTDYVKAKYPELTSEDELAEEVFAHYSGKRGAERLKAEMKAEMEKADGVFEKAKVGSVFANIKALLDRFWNMARDLFSGKVEGIEKMKSEDFADMAMNDLLGGFDPGSNDGVKAAKSKEGMMFQKGDEQGYRDGEEEDSVKDKVLSLFHSAANGEFNGGSVKIGTLTDDGRRYLESVSGIDMKDVVDFMLNPSDLRHIYSEHYGENEKDKGNNIPLTDSDIRFMVDVISNPDYVAYGVNKKTGNKTFVFLKRNENGTYNLAEIYTTKRGNLTAKSFYNTKKGISQRANELNSKSLHFTPKTEGESLLGAKIPKLFELSEKNLSKLGAEYKEAVENGDMEKAAELVKHAAKMAMPNTKVVDEKGEPMVVYHGTLNTDEKRVWNDKMKWYDTEHSRFNVFKRVVDGERNQGHFFVSEKGNAEGYGDLYSVFLNISNPLVIDANNQTYNRIEFKGKTYDTYGWAEYAEKNGYDGVIFNNIRDGVDYGAMEKSVNEYVAFSSSQIKSADPITYDDNGNVIPLSERFNDENEDTRYRDGEEDIVVNQSEYAKIAHQIATYPNKEDRCHVFTDKFYYLCDNIDNEGNFSIKAALPIKGNEDLINELRHEKTTQISGTVRDTETANRLAERISALGGWVRGDGTRSFELLQREGTTGMGSVVVERESDSRTNKQTTAAIRESEKQREVVSQLSSKLNVPVRVIEDVNEITHANGAIESRRRRAKGWYNTNTGEVVIVLPNNRNTEDVAATMCHEIVAHKGLRELVGEENYNAFLDEVYGHLNGELKYEVDMKAGRSFTDDTLDNGEKAKSYEEHRRIQTDELFGRLAEKPFEDFTEKERTLWQHIKEAVRRILDRFLGTMKLPSWVELGDNELRYMLWRSRERLEHGKENYVDKARDIVKRNELGLDDEAVYSRRYFGGNSGYVGYSKSKRAVDAEERGLRSKSQMDRFFAEEVNELIKKESPDAPTVTLKQIKDSLSEIRADEWHHTSMYGNRTNYYSAETIAAFFTPQSESAEEKALRDKLESRKQERLELIADLQNAVYNSVPTEPVTDAWTGMDIMGFRTSDGHLVWHTKNTLEPSKNVRIIPKGSKNSIDAWSEWAYEHWEEYNKAKDEYNAAKRDSYEKIPQEKKDRLKELVKEINDIEHDIYFGANDRYSEGEGRTREFASLSSEEKFAIKEKLESATPTHMEKNSIVAKDGKSARKIADEWANIEFERPREYDTEVGVVTIDKKSVSSSLGHGYGQAKLDALPTLKEGFNNAVYLGSVEDYEDNPINNHFFAYPVEYNRERGYVFCRAREDNNLNRLYVHEVYYVKELKGNSLQTRAGAELDELPRGTSLYKRILTDILSVSKDTKNSENGKKNLSKLDAEYKEAVENGDMEKAKQMFDDAAKQAMRNSAFGTKGFYHNTPNNFTIFDEARNGTHNDAGWLGDGFYFYGDENEGNGYGKNKMMVFLNIENPYFATYEDVSKLAEQNNRAASIEFRQKLEAEGYDGVYYNGDLRQEAVAFYPNQIKSADPVTYDDNGNVIPLSERFNDENEDIRYRDEEDTPEGTDDIWNDQSMGMQEKMTLAAMRLAELNKNDAGAKSEAVRMANKSLMSLTKAMRLQKQFDKTTVKRVSDLAKVLIRHGYISDMGRSEVSRLLSVINNAAGRQDIKKDVQKVMDIMIDNQLRRAEESLGKLMATKGTKTDSRGVVVQGVLDVAGQQVMKTFKAARSWKEEEIEDAIADAMKQPLAVRSGSSRRCRSCRLGVWPQMLKKHKRKYFRLSVGGASDRRSSYVFM